MMENTERAQLNRFAVHFSSDSEEWETPQAFFDKLHKKFDFTLDPCASEQNYKCNYYFTEKDEGLKLSWKGHRVFMNPPYGREIGKWIKKAYEESKQSNTLVVALIPARTDTVYWHDYVMKSSCIYFIKGRLKFGQSKNSAPFPSAVVVFNGYTNTPVVTTMERS